MDTTKEKKDAFEDLIYKAIDANNVKDIIEFKKYSEKINAKKRFVEDKCKLQGKLVGISKDGKIAYGNTKYTYIKLEDIMAELKPLLVLYNFSFSWQTYLDKIECIISHKDGHSETSSFCFPIKLDKVENGRSIVLAQDRGAVTSYGMRFSLLLAFGIVAETDTDGLGKVPVKKETIKKETIKKETIKKQQLMDVINNDGSLTELGNKIKAKIDSKEIKNIDDLKGYLNKISISGLEKIKEWLDMRDL